jgi:hypothetical protein
MKIRFPLTLTLSLGEREQLLPLRICYASVSESQRWKRFSLSPRERAGVRGKGLLDWMEEA